MSQVILTGGSCNIPNLKRLLKEEFPSAEFHCSLPPNETVVLGCANEAGILGGRAIGSNVDNHEVNLLPCTPHNLWITVRISHLCSFYSCV